MNSLTHDPYLNTVKRSLEDKRYKQKYENKHKIDKFLKKNISITDYINLSEGMATVILFISFLIIPYIIGIGFIFFIIAQANLDAFRGINIDEYSVFWAIGYEVIASILLLLIVKSAIRFKRL